MVWSYTRANITERALRLCGLLATGQAGSTEQTAVAVTALQAILEDLNNDGYKQTQVEWVTKALAASSEVVGYKCKRSHTSTAADEPGVGANWQKYWEVDATALVGVWAGGTAYVSIRDVVTGTDTIGLLLVYLQNSTTNDVEYALSQLTMQQYHDIEDKYTTGSPTAYYVEEGTPPRIIFDYEPDSTGYILNYVRIKKMTSIDAAGDSLDSEKRWWDAITFRLASELGYEYSISVSKQDRLDLKSKEMLAKAKKRDFYLNSVNGHTAGAY